MIMPTITRTASKATSESWAGSERPNTLILTLLPVRGGSDRDVLPFLRLELTSVYGHWCSEVPRTLSSVNSVSENPPSRQLVNRGGQHALADTSCFSKDALGLASCHHSPGKNRPRTPRRYIHLSRSDLIRWGGLLALVAAALLIIADLVTVVSAFGQGSMGGLLFRATLSASAGVLLALGLVSLYAPQTQEAGYLGLVGFLAAFLALWLSQENLVWAALVANVGWALFGVGSLQARTYPRVATILLIVGAVLAGVINLVFAALSLGQTTTAAYFAGLGALADIIFNVGVAWLGLSLFMGRRAQEEV